MTIYLYKYERFPKNPYLIPNIFMEKNIVKNFKLDNDEKISSSISKLMIKLNLMYGDKLNYDSRVIGNTVVDMNIFVCFFNDMFEKLLKDSTVDYFFSKTGMICDSLFSKTEISYDNLHCEFYNQLLFFNSTKKVSNTMMRCKVEINS